MAAPSTSDPHRPGATGPILLAAGLVLAAVLVFWPGIATYDSVVQYAQPLSGRYDDWHPPVMARLWSLTHYWIAGAGPLLALQMAGYGLGLGLIAGRMRRLGRPRAALAVMLIGRAAEGLRQGALADQLGVEAPSVVPLIDQLERSGLVERRVDTTDKRARLLHLTAAGTTLAAQVEARTAEIRQTLLACIEAEELVIATRVLDRLHATMTRLDDQG